MAHHKHSDSAVSDELYFPGLLLEVESTALISPSCLSPSHNRLARSSSAHSSKTTYARDSGSTSVQSSLLTSTTGDTLIVYKGVRVVVKHSPTSVSWKPSRLSLCGTEAAFVQKLQYSDILSARVLPGPKSCAACHACLEVSPDEPDQSFTPPGSVSPPTVPPFVSPFLHQTAHWALTPTDHDPATSSIAATKHCQHPDHFHVTLGYTLIIFSYGRKRGTTNDLRLKTHQLYSNSMEVLKELAAAINAHVGSLPDRPRNVLVFINPFSGARAARRVWSKTVQPVFNNALVKYTLVCTEYMDHAKEYIANMKRDELEQYQGLVAIGGDGLFQELVRGLVCHKGVGALPKIRLGHIPAGSTDAVAYTLHGTRSVMTAALHIAVGSRMPVDLSKVTSDDGSVRYSMCMAGYGFLGDVMAASEMLRWMGPVRYDVAGALRYLRLRSYKVEVQYKPAVPLRDGQEAEDTHVCYRGCPTCRAAASISNRPTSPFAQQPAGTSGADDDGWVTQTGEFASIMCVTTPCRSDKSKSGVVPSAHLSDGRLVLVLVHACVHVQYLRFLISLAQTGVQPGMFPFVEMHRVSAVRFRGLNNKSRNSVWNIDGELLHNPDMQIQVQQGMIDVFSRGLERPV